MFLGSKAAHETTISTGAAPARMDMHGKAQKTKAISPTCEKPWENQSFAAERTGTELLGVFPVFLKEFEKQGERLVTQE